MIYHFDQELKRHEQNDTHFVPSNNMFKKVILFTWLSLFNLIDFSKDIIIAESRRLIIVGFECDPTMIA